MGIVYILIYFSLFWKAEGQRELKVSLFQEAYTIHNQRYTMNIRKANKEKAEILYGIF